MQGPQGIQGPAGVPSYTEGTFTVTATGMTTTVTGTARYVRVGTQVTVMLPQLTGTSNAAAVTITGIPAALAPVAVHRAWVFVENAGAFVVGDLYILAGQMSITVRPPIGTPWTASGSKTVYETSHTWIVA
jgi:hypothetical protein